MFGGNFAIRSYALCQGQLLAISSNTALFSILGTTYGGDGRTTFALPDLRGRVPIQQGNGPGLSHYSLGQRGGVEDVTLNAAQIPTGLTGSGKIQGATTGSQAVPSPNGYPATPSGRVTSGAGAGGGIQVSGWGTDKDSTYGATDGVSVTVGGGGLSHTNIQPYLGINYEICLFGIFPSRN